MPVIWLVAGIALVVAELFTLDFVMIMLGAGALAAAGVGAAGAGLLVQVVVFSGVSALGLLAVRPAIRRWLHGGAAETRMGIEAIEGSEAVVVEQVSESGGMVKIGGEMWSARSFDAAQVIGVGQHVRVVEIKGATALVWRE